MAEDGGFAAAGGVSSSLASGGEEAAVAFEGEPAVADTAGDVAGTWSFSGDTPVATASGETPIDQLQPGDQVEAYYPATGTTGPQTITAVWAHTDQTIETVTVDGEAIETTPEHPFAIVGAGCVPAGTLWVGAQVQREDSSVATVQAISFAQHSQVMYNLTVATAHTFFVGQQQALVHNTCAGNANRFSEDQDALIKLARDAERVADQTAGIPKEDAAVLREWAEEYNIPSRGPESHPGRGYGQHPHIHIGPINHTRVSGW